MHPADSGVNVQFETRPFSLRVEKPWGYEILLTPPGLAYAGKLLHINAGQRLSLQYHDEKAETITLLRGRVLLQVDAATGSLETFEMQARAGYSIVPGQRHRLIAIDDCDLFEASMPERGTTYRIEDDAGRGHETEAMRDRPDRGWTG